MNNVWTIFVFILKFILGSTLFKTLAAEGIDRLVRSTETNIDDNMAAPLLKYLRSNTSSSSFLNTMLGSTIINRITLSVIVGLVKSTETDIDDNLVEPFLKYLK